MEHDSLEDYLELSEKLSKDGNKFKGIVATAQKRRECERKALGIVQLFLERSVCADIFLKSIIYLNPSYYEDVAEERALLLLCGYPLCRKRISKPRNRYSICNKARKVYDLNEYGNFCSVFCFNASNHIKSQILDSPLWLRDLEDPPTFSLLIKRESSHATAIDIKSRKVEKKEEFTPISSFAELSLDDVGDIKFSVPVINEKRVGPSMKGTGKMKMATVMENDVEDTNEQSEKRISENNSEYFGANKQYSEILNVHNSKEGTTGSNTTKSSNSRLTDCDRHNKNLKTSERTEINQSQEKSFEKAPKLKDLKTITDNIKRKIRKPLIPMIDPLPFNTKTSEVLKLQENKHEIQSESMKNKSLIELKFSFKESASTIENSIMNIFKSWLSLETLMFIHGEETIKELLDVNKLTEHFEKLKVAQLETDQQHKYISICKRLCEQEIFEEKIDSLCIKHKLVPLPDYKQLKQESKEFNVKVSTFYSGDLLETDDKNFGQVGEKHNSDTDIETTFIPLDDINSQNTLRQQILLKTLKNSMEYFLDYIEYEAASVITELSGLVKTFKLNAENIVFKLIIRNYLGLICLRILSLKDEKLCKALEKAEFLELENCVYQQLPGEKQVLTNSLNLINDVDNFVESYVISRDR